MKNNIKNQYDKMTKTPIHKLIVQLSIPTIISMLVTNIYNMADTAFVGRFGNSASGAVGIVFGFMAILQSVGFMFGQGSGSIVSRLLGKKDIEGGSKIASTGFFLSIMLGIIIEILGFIFMEPMIRLLGSTATILPYAKKYIFFILLAAPFMVPSFVMNNLLRYEGKAALGMMGLMTGAVLNIAGDLILMFGFNMGIRGAGLSTAISQIVSFSILLSMFLRGKTQCRLSVKMITWRLRDIAEICGTGLPSLLRQGLGSLTTMILNNLASVYGDAALAAISIVSRVSMFVFSFAIGIGQGFQPVSGFNYGAKKYKRVRKAFWFTLILAEVLIFIISMTVFAFSSDVVRVFRDDAEVILIGTRALRLQCLALIFMPVSMAVEMLMQSTGKKFAASLLSSLKGGLIFIPLLFLLAKLRGLYGIQEAQPITFVLAAIPAIAFGIWFFGKLPKEDLETNA